MSENLPVLIPASAFANYFDCPICFETIQTSLMCTPCGHHFCERCITESVNVSHRCPCCNTPVTRESLHRDHQYDAIAAKYMEEKAKAEAQYFDNIIHAAAAQQEGGGVALTPIEAVFQKHMQESLAAYDKLTRDARRRFEALKSKVPPTSPELAVLDEKMARVESLIVSAYDSFLQKSFARPRVLPVNVSVYIPSKDITVRQIQITPTDTGLDVQTKLFEKLKTDKHEIISIDPSVKFVVKQVLHVSEEPQIVISPSSHPLLEFYIDPESELILDGAIVFKEDLPRSCYATTFNKEHVEPADFYHCKDCDKNWICESCKDVCHRGHEVTGFMKQHKPTWGCCYCPKTKRCCLQGKTASSSASAPPTRLSPAHRSDPWEAVAFPGLDGSM